MKCAGCQEDNAVGATHCTSCGGRLYDYPWHVWWRYSWDDRERTTAWHDAPKLYRTESAARDAERDLNKEYCWPHIHARIQHVALPRGVHPNELYL